MVYGRYSWDGHGVFLSFFFEGAGFFCVEAGS
jgi:hypothetical protein